MVAMPFGLLFAPLVLLLSSSKGAMDAEARRICEGPCVDKLVTEKYEEEPPFLFVKANVIIGYSVLGVISGAVCTVVGTPIGVVYQLIKVMI